VSLCFVIKTCKSCVTDLLEQCKALHLIRCGVSPAFFSFFGIFTIKSQQYTGFFSLRGFEYTFALYFIYMITLPAIYPETLEEVTDKLYALVGITDYVQIVLCDGSYGMRVSWDPEGKEILPDAFEYEFDLILTSWREYIEKAYRLGVKSVVIHVDEFTDKEYEDLFDFIRTHKLRLGVTISNELSIDLLINAMHKIKEQGNTINRDKIFIQVPGQRNINDDKRSFDERVLSRIRILKNLFPDIMLQVSGRINPSTAGIVKEAGADRLVVTSYIFGHENLREAIAILEKAVAKKPEPVKLVPEVMKEKHEEVKESKEIEVIKEVQEKVIPPPVYVTKNEIDPRYKASNDELLYETEDDILKE
jgi:pentose-5-phosphate-3-epimerase